MLHQHVHHLRCDDDLQRLVDIHLPRHPGRKAPDRRRVAVSARLLVAQIGFENLLVFGREGSGRRPLVAASTVPYAAPVRILGLVVGTRGGGSDQGGCQQCERKADGLSGALKPQDHDDAVSRVGLERCRPRNSGCSMMPGAPSHEILVLVLQRENITAVGTTPTSHGGRGGRSAAKLDRATRWSPVAHRLVPAGCRA